MITAARIPAAHIVALAPLRADDRIRIHAAADHLWVCWPAELAQVLLSLRPVPGVEFFEQHAQRWHRAGRRIPSAHEPPPGDGEPLTSHLAPARSTPRPTSQRSVPPLTWGLRRGGSPTAATALLCSMTALQAWANLATTLELTGLKAAYCGPSARVLGAKLPSMAGAMRYHGGPVYLPLGCVTSPEMSDSLLSASLGITASEVAFVDEHGTEIIPTTVFHPLTRAGLRQVSA